MKNRNQGEKSSPLLTPLSHLVIIAAVAALVVAAARQSLAAEYAWLTMIALALCVAPVSALSIPGIKARITLGDAVTFTCAALFGPNAAIITAMTDGACASLA